MLQLFQYNWQVRNEWFDWCNSLSVEHLLQNRKGGVGSFLQTLFHIVDVESSYIREMKGEPDLAPNYHDYMSLEQVRKLSDLYHEEVAEFIGNWSSEMDQEIVTISWLNDSKLSCGEILRHILTHEIHHIGQLSIWAKELDKPVVSASYIGRGLH
ncbi:DinB family protein [Paenibacillus eucommiae]|uniref:Damage-inducible protein DinB n=1 Tax=Paenibacillus eucommiae TaxID=1355755 RepID=A0ABS4IPS2_9BACL|nr:DinB family protein [Paenibacillus eucommiae]MBP1989026.1 putative damage-inducible protein DinB [Paenibacillus eucommiae]